MIDSIAPRGAKRSLVEETRHHPLARELKKKILVEVVQPIARSRRALKLATFLACSLLGLTCLLEAEHAHDLGFLYQYAARWGQDILSIFRGG